LATGAYCDSPKDHRSCTYFVAPSGSDDNDGVSVKTPFATLKRAQLAARRGNNKVVCVRAGTYNIADAIALTNADSGETWRYYPPDNVNSAVLDGGNAVNLFTIDGASNVTINGLKLQHVFDAAILTRPNNARSDNITIENCDIGFNQHTSYAGGFNPLIAIANATNTRILNNYLHDTASQGVALYAYNIADTIEGSTIIGNVLLRTVQQKSDGGAIYINMRKTNVRGGHVTITNNFVKDFGAAGVQAEGIYLDDDASNVEVNGNVIGPMHPAAIGTGSKATSINGGCCNRFIGNIIDLGSTAQELIAGWTEPGGGGAIFFDWTSPNVFEGNVIVSRYAGATRASTSGIAGREYVQGIGYPPAMGIIARNAYFNYGGGAKMTSGNIISDAEPIVVDPELSGWLYTMAERSPARRLLKFAAIAGGWGPPGFVLSREGTSPSNPE
jgi:hypothetical protein